VGWGFPAVGPRLRILLAELMASYVGILRLSSRRASSAHTDGRAEGILCRSVGGFPAAGPRLRILMAALRASNVGNRWAWCRMPWAHSLPRGFLRALAIGRAAEVYARVLQSDEEVCSPVR